MESNSQFAFTSKNDINKHVWYSIPMLVLNHRFSIDSEFPR